MLDREGKSTNVVKSKLEWDKHENEASENNASHVLHFQCN